ncbi:VCBS domain-containing protein [Shewanella xiamenensis]|uniref:VCBS domain-containing protein n=1 Tax=Shewanella xiamenensis TaxID=332186 RepID=UPI00294A6D1B|nr:VCBS domain-containing protein [Shewanella xiamenensis]MDV5246406.1 VCBS domain-containing protein [Shewanella xiamenensis]
MSPMATTTFSIDADGNWTYVLNNSHIDVQSLAAGETLTRNITVTSADGTATHTVTITIVGANDPADITVGEGQGDTDNGTVTEDGDSDTDVATVQTVGGKLDVTDVDNGEAVFKSKPMSPMATTVPSALMLTATGPMSLTTAILMCSHSPPAKP